MREETSLVCQASETHVPRSTLEYLQWFKGSEPQQQHARQSGQKNFAQDTFLCLEYQCLQVLHQLSSALNAADTRTRFDDVCCAKMPS